jgi:hypothetical protein
MSASHGAFREQECRVLRLASSEDKLELAGIHLLQPDK